MYSHDRHSNQFKLQILGVHREFIYQRRFKEKKVAWSIPLSTGMLETNELLIWSLLQELSLVKASRYENLISYKF